MLDLSILDVKMLKYLPSEIAATAVWMGIKVCENKDLLKEVATNARCKEETIKECSNELLHLIKKFEKGSLKAVNRKYALAKFSGVSKIKIDGKFN